MEDKKIIMLFLDLEGTIIDEQTGEIQEEKIKGLLGSLSRLQRLTGSTVNINIASPVMIQDMERVIDELDTIIVRYNIMNNTNLKEVQSAVAYPDTTYIQTSDLYDKIFPLKLNKNGDDGGYGKQNFVKQWIETMENKIDFSIYGGNGLNDKLAMEYVKRSGKGFGICPQNSHPKLKEIADYVSEQSDIDGIKDGIDFINAEIEKRKVKDEDYDM